MLNPNTRVAVCGYAGDAHQVTAALKMYTHHECPLTILSPEDAKIEIEGVDCRFGGKRAYIGQDSLDRQRDHLRILMTYPEKYFLINDSDSMCLSPKIPAYLYMEDILWSNLVVDNMEFRQKGYYPDGFPKLAFQPPYFMSRNVIATLLACVEGDNITANPMLAFIDHYMVQLAVKANQLWAGFIDGVSYPISGDRNSARVAWDAVRHRGVVMIHSVKSPEFWQPLADAYNDPRRNTLNPFPMPGAEPPPPPRASAAQRQALLMQQRRAILSTQRGHGLKA